MCMIRAKSETHSAAIVTHQLGGSLAFSRLGVDIVCVG